MRIKVDIAAKWRIENEGLSWLRLGKCGVSQTFGPLLYVHTYIHTHLCHSVVYNTVGKYMCTVS